jgi:hypothetical protein
MRSMAESFFSAIRPLDGVSLDRGHRPYRAVSGAPAGEYGGMGVLPEAAGVASTPLGRVQSFTAPLTGLDPGECPQVFLRNTRGAAAIPCRGKAIERRMLDGNHDSGCCHRIGQPLRLTRRRTPRRSPISRNFLRLAAKNRPTTGRSPQSLLIWICQLWALQPSRTKTPAS